MEAVIFAAGLGTRLGALTADRPKALVEVGGVPLIERVARRLVAAGVTRLVVNVCPFADAIEAFVASRDGFGAEVAFSREAPTPLETGGGLRAAAALLPRSGPLLLHNVDVLTDLPLRDLVAAHVASGAVATLAVMDRPTARRLRFDAHGLQGRVDDGKGERIDARPAVGPVVERGFCGVHVLDAAWVSRITAPGAYSVLVPYLAWAGAGARLLPWAADGHAWVDVGRPADLARAEAALAR